MSGQLNRLKGNLPDRDARYITLREQNIVRVEMTKGCFAVFTLAELREVLGSRGSFTFSWDQYVKAIARGKSERRNAPRR